MNKRGGKRKGAGRKPDGDKPRVLLVAKVLSETKIKIDKLRGELSVGKLLDKIIKSQ